MGRGIGRVAASINVLVAVDSAVVTSDSIAVMVVSDATVLLAEGAVMAGSAGPIIRCDSFVI